VLRLQNTKFLPGSDSSVVLLPASTVPVHSSCGSVSFRNYQAKTAVKNRERLRFSFSFVSQFTFKTLIHNFFLVKCLVNEDPDYLLKCSVDQCDMKVVGIKMESPLLNPSKMESEAKKEEPLHTPAC
jgi:hypothetical protein